MRKGDLVQYIARIPDVGVGIVLEKYERNQTTTLGLPFNECRVHFTKPSHIKWVPEHHLTKIIKIK